MPNYTPALSADDIREAFMDFGVFGAKFYDELYALIARPWLDKFGPSFRAFRRHMLKIPDYAAEANDCDDFVADARFWASVLHRNNRRDAALAFGRCVYTPADQLGLTKPVLHAICVAACRDRGAIVPVFFEPQEPGIITMTYEEISSASLEF